MNNNSLAAPLVSSIAVVALVSPAAEEINLATAAADPNSRRKEGRNRERKELGSEMFHAAPLLSERGRGAGKTALPFISKPVDH